MMRARRPALAVLVLAAQAAPARALPTPDAASAPPPVQAAPHLDPSTPAGGGVDAAADVPGDAAAPQAPSTPGAPATPGELPVDATPAIAAEPGPAHAVDEADLQALGIDASSGTSDDKLTVYGFASFSYMFTRYVKAEPTVRQTTSTFAIGNLNLYVGKELAPRLRTLGEVKLTFLPNGNGNADGSYTTAVAADPTDFFRPAPWGGIHVERAYLELDVADWLTIRAGRWLTPYGIWNVDHGPPAIIPINRPYVIGEQYFPEHQTGIELLGRHFTRGFTVAYHLTASNGRGASEAQLDQDNELALGARLELETPWGVHVGASHYRGRYSGFPISTLMPDKNSHTYQEAAYAADVEYNRGAVHAQAELVVHEIHYEPGARATSWSGGFVPDHRGLGYYVLAGRRFERWWNVMPFAYYEDYRPHAQGVTRVWGLAAGLNFRPISSVVLKVQANRAQFDDDSILFPGSKIYLLTAQASWVL